MIAPWLDVPGHGVFADNGSSSEEAGGGILKGCHKVRSDRNWSFLTGGHSA